MIKIILGVLVVSIIGLGGFLVLMPTKSDQPGSEKVGPNAKTSSAPLATTKPGSQASSAVSSSPTPQGSIKSPSQKSLEKLRGEVKKSYTKANEEEILVKFDEALATETSDQLYLKLKEIFNLMVKGYNDYEANTEGEKEYKNNMHDSLEDVQKYAKTLPEYKSGDFVVPE